MNREEAINKLVNARYADEFQGDEELTTAHLMAINALEQEPSEDCVSRKAMLDAITEIDENINMDIYTNEVREIIRELPPVTPARKKGKWIKVTNGRGGHECNICHEYAPSFQNGEEYLSNYCPNCGAEMESE